MDIVTLLAETSLVSSRSEARRLIDQGGITLGQERVESIDRVVTLEDFSGNELIIRKGKKIYHRVIVQ
jgi:tyrosyl-tRNA synthetase